MNNKMIKLLKKIIKKFANLLGFEVSKFYPELKQKTFDEIYKEILDNNITVIDVGANRGQSIDRFKKVFDSYNIHSFEPIDFEFKNLVNKYNNKNNIYLNNSALGEKKEKKIFNINHYTGSSSFLKVTNNTDWLKLRSREHGIRQEEFLKKKEEVQVDTLDNYSQKNNISKIDILKIDTQGYELNVLKGAKKLIDERKISFIELELIFSDLYENTLTIGEIENVLGKNYRLFANDNFGNLYSNMIFQLNLIYVEKQFFKMLQQKR